MKFYSAIGFCIAISILGTASAFGQEEKRDDPEALKLAVFFVEDKPIEGVTKSEGFRVGEGEGQELYLHKKPVLFVDSDTVRSFTLSSQDFSDVSGRGAVNYNMIMHFNSAARKQLANALDGNGDHMRHVTVFIGRKRFGLQRYELKNVGPEMCRAETFSLLFSPPSKSDTLRIVDALLK